MMQEEGVVFFSGDTLEFVGRHLCGRIPQPEGLCFAGDTMYVMG